MHRLNIARYVPLSGSQEQLQNPRNHLYREVRFSFNNNKLTLELGNVTHKAAHGGHLDGWEDSVSFDLTLDTSEAQIIELLNLEPFAVVNEVLDFFRKLVTARSALDTVLSI